MPLPPSSKPLCWNACGSFTQRLGRSLFFGLAAIFLGADVQAGEIIELKSGHSLEGEVIKERPEELILDVGVEILRIPTDRIARRRKSDADPSLTKVEDHDGFYLTAELPRGTVKSLSAKFGEGVVLVQTPSGLGSGFMINKKGYCVTNHHVIENETRISVTIFKKSGDEFIRRRIEDVKIVAINPFLDLALLKAPGQDDLEYSPVLLAEKDELVEGDPTFAIGNPLGLERTVSEGIISTKNRNIDGKIYLQTTTQINPGNSGGPLLNLRGQVVGVTSMRVIGGEGLGFAIPVTYLRHFIENRDAFSYDETNPNNGFRYLDAPRRRTRRTSSLKTTTPQPETVAAQTDE